MRETSFLFQRLCYNSSFQRSSLRRYFLSLAACVRTPLGPTLRLIIMQTFIQDFLHTYTYTYVHTVLNNASVTHKVRCFPTLVTARKQYMRTHPILTALIGIYTKYLHSIVSPAVYVLRLQ